MMMMMMMIVMVVWDECMTGEGIVWIGWEDMSVHDGSTKAKKREKKI